MFATAMKLSELSLASIHSLSDLVVEGVTKFKPHVRDDVRFLTRDDPGRVNGHISSETP